MKKILSSILVSSILLTNLAYADRGYIFRSFGEAVTRGLEVNLNLVTNVPVGQLKPGDEFVIKAFPEDVSDYEFRLSANIDGDIQEIISYGAQNTLSYVLPSVYAKIIFKVEARKITDQSVISKNLVTEFAAPLILSKSKVYQKEDFVINHPAIQFGKTYNVVFDNGIGFRNISSQLSTIDGELSLEVPVYQGSEKLAVSIEGIKLKERVKLSVRPGAGISASNNKVRNFETLSIVLKEDIVVDTEFILGNIDQREIEITKISNNKLAWVVYGLSPGFHTLSFNVQGIDFSYELEVLPDQEIINPQSYIDGYSNMLATTLTSLQNNPNVSTQLLGELTAKFNQFDNIANQLSTDEKITLVNYIEANKYLFPNMKLKNQDPSRETSSKLNVQFLFKFTIGMGLLGYVGYKTCLKSPTTQAICTIGGITLIALAANGFFDGLGPIFANKIGIFKGVDYVDDQFVFENNVIKTTPSRASYSNFNKKMKDFQNPLVQSTYKKFLELKENVILVNLNNVLSLPVFDIDQHNEIITTDITDTSKINFSVSKSTNVVELTDFIRGLDNFGLKFKSTDFGLKEFDLNYQYSSEFVQSYSKVFKAKVSGQPCQSPKLPYIIVNSKKSLFDSRFPWYDNEYGVPDNLTNGIQCKEPDTDRQNYTHPSWGYSLASGAQAPTEWPTPKIEYVGCSYDGVKSKSLFKFSSPAAADGYLYDASYDSVLVCAEKFDTLNYYKSTDKLIAEKKILTPVLDPEYFSVRGFPFCYRYKHYLTSSGVTQGVVRFIEDLSVPFEDCSDCRAGLVKINGSCTCPPGMTEGALGCTRNIGCKSYADYNGGICNCPGGKPYLTSDLLAAPRFTCTEPLTKDAGYDGYSRVPNSSITGTASVQGCQFENGKPKVMIDINLNNSNTRFGALFKFVCTGVYYKDTINLSKSSWQYSPVTTVDSNISPASNFLRTIKLSSVGDCYKWTAYAIDGFSVAWEKEIDIPYCKPEK